MSSPKVLAHGMAFAVSFLVPFSILCSPAQLAAQAKEIRIAAASDLQPVMPILAAEYEKAKGIKLTVSYGSSATLIKQILNGAPIDVFLSADYLHPERLVAEKLADTSAPIPYAKGTLVLWARNDSPFKPLTLEALTDPRVKAIAIADDLHAPYGRAAVAALKGLKVDGVTTPKLVKAENVVQAAQFVESGNAQLGLISLTLASSAHLKELGTYVLVPTSVYPHIDQCGVVMAKSDRRTEAHAFMDWLLSSAVQQNLIKLGLNPVR